MSAIAINDLIIRIKNGYLAQKEQIESPYSKMRVEVLKKLKELGYIADFKEEEISKGVKKLVIDLKYEANTPALVDVKLYSKSGRRWYIKAKEINAVKGNTGYLIISTSKGIMTNYEAKEKNLGGELLFEIY
ncbi:MAG: 30S ribosomal protein S8 [Patescibacteria group bacterium]|nr:MAG: 30S ribosomal protein S8 [Patescibacteria group bacterium]